MSGTRRAGAGRAGRVIDGTIVAYLVFALFSIAVSEIAMTLGGLVWLGTTLFGRSGRRPRLPVLGAFAAFGAASLISALAGLDVAAGLWGLRSLWIPPLFFLVCVDRLQDPTTALGRARLLLAFAALAAVYGLSQAVREGTDFRITGTLSHYMTFAGVLMLAGLLGFALMLVPDTARRRLPWGLALAMILLALLATQTRSAWLGFAAGATAVMWIRRRRLVWLVPLVAVVAVLVSPAEIKQRMLSFFDPHDVTAVERTYMWRSGARILLDHPLTGVGPGRENLKRIYPQYKEPDDPWLPDHPFTHLHNNLMQVVVERGLLGLGTWLAIWVVWFLRVRRILAGLPPGDGVARALVSGSVAAVIGFLVSGLFEYNFGDSEVIDLTCFIMALPFAASAHDDAASGPTRAVSGVDGG